MIALDKVSARGAKVWFKTPSLIHDVTFTWERGVLAILGAPADGTTVLLETLAGILPVRAGNAVVDGVTPGAARSRVAWVSATTSLPDALRVEELCTLEAELRGQEVTTPASRLGVLGLESLAKRRVRSLAPGEARSVALALALTSKAPVVLVDEPLAGLEAMAPGRVIEALRACGKNAAVVVTTSSVRDATRVADQLGILVRGAFKHLSASLAHAGAGVARLRVVIAAEDEEEVAPFVEALRRDAAVAATEAASYRGTRVLHAAMAVVVAGPDLLALARAVANAATATHANVLTIESAVLPLDAIRAAVMGVAPAMITPPPASPEPVVEAPASTGVVSAELLPSEDIEIADAVSEPSAKASEPAPEPPVVAAKSPEPPPPPLALTKPSLPPPLPPRARTVGIASAPRSPTGTLPPRPVLPPRAAGAPPLPPRPPPPLPPRPVKKAPEDKS